MTTVPTWIATAHVYQPGRGVMSNATAKPIRSWRATKTQVVVTVDMPRGPVERRFRLDDLREVSSADPRPVLCAADDPSVVEAIQAAVVDAAAQTVLAAWERQRVRTGMRAEDLAASLDAIALAAAKALASLRDAL